MVKVYTTTWCAYCPQVKKWLSMKGQDFEAIDVTDDLEKQKELHTKTGMTSVPVVERDGRFVVGPQWGKLAELIS